VKTVRKFAYRHWLVTCVALGAALGIDFWYALPATAQTRPIFWAIGMLAGSVTTMLLKCEPRPEWAHGKPAKGRA
jgi:Na+-transporting NADH:ubiquinone oxidoreductase subunit NqrB